MPFSLKPSASLARSTLRSMGVRIAAVIALTTFFSYLHVLRTLRSKLNPLSATRSA